MLFGWGWVSKADSIKGFQASERFSIQHFLRSPHHNTETLQSSPFTQVKTIQLFGLSPVFGCKSLENVLL